MTRKQMIASSSRRSFLKGIGAAAAAGVALNPVMGMFDKAFAGGDNLTGYKALVCVFFFGGNDGLNWFVPMSSNSGGVSDYSTYGNTRGEIALPTSKLLKLGTSAVGSDKNTYGIHGSCPEMQALFNANQMAVLANVGTLVGNVTPAMAKTNPALLPNYLFSHDDQQHEWMTSMPSSPVQSVGWAGRIGDLLATQGSNPLAPLNISLAGNNLLQAGLQTGCYAMSPSGPSALQLGTQNSNSTHGNINATFQTLLTQAAADSNPMVKTYGNFHTQAAGYVPVFKNALAAAGTFKTVFPVPPTDAGNGGLDAQFMAVAQMIKAQSTLKGTRQIFFVAVNNFDTHANQVPVQAANLSAVSPLMKAFNDAMIEIGQQNNVTQFTMSDFGRTLGTNSGGTDHGWGSYHVAVGGAVQGGKIYGNSPSLTIGGADDFGSGRIIPTTSTDQYIATLMQWFGISATDTATLLPNLANFKSNMLYNFKSPSNIGFLG